MQPFQLILRPSKRLAVVSMAAHVVAVWIMLVYFEAWLRVLGVSACLASAAWWWRGWQRSLVGQTLAVDSKGQLAVIDQHGVMRSAVLLDDSLIHRYGCFLHLQTEQQRWWQSVLPDMADEESYRRLLVWARFGRPKNEHR